MRERFNEGDVEENMVFIISENSFEQIRNPCTYYRIGDPIVNTFLAIGIQKGNLYKC